MKLRIRFKKLGKEEKEFMDWLVKVTNEQIQQTISELKNSPLGIFISGEKVKQLKGLKVGWYEEKGCAIFVTTMGKAKGIFGNKFVKKLIEDLKRLMKEKKIEYRAIEVIE